MRLLLNTAGKNLLLALCALLLSIRGNSAAPGAAGSTLPATKSRKIQLPYTFGPTASASSPAGSNATPSASREIRGRHIPESILVSELASVSLSNHVVPLPEANTLAHLNFIARRFGRLQTDPTHTLLFNPEIILVKFRTQPHVAALRVEPMREWEAVQALARRADVQFAELDAFQERQFTPTDPLVTNQWHHAILNSFQAWNLGLGQSWVRIAIVDTPFQMDHPDLAANTLAGWDAVANVPILSSAGLAHSTMCAGLAAAAINNDLGVAGAGNFQVLPININGALSEMYHAIVWAADHGVRVVNISWSGADSDTLETAAQYLKVQARGIVAMAGVDGTGYLNYTNQPDIYCISMTDAADNLRSVYGPHIDFAAPGWQVYSTTTGAGYDYGSGTSYSTPLFCGVVAFLFSVNPTLGPDEVIAILRNTALDLGPPGWDPYYGWGRIDFASAATAALATRPVISSIRISDGQVAISVDLKPGLKYQLWRTNPILSSAWELVSGAISQTNQDQLVVIDPFPPAGEQFYRIEATSP